MVPIFYLNSGTAVPSHGQETEYQQGRQDRKIVAERVGDGGGQKLGGTSLPPCRPCGIALNPAEP